MAGAIVRECWVKSSGFRVLICGLACRVSSLRSLKSEFKTSCCVWFFILSLRVQPIELGFWGWQLRFHELKPKLETLLRL